MHFHQYVEAVYVVSGRMEVKSKEDVCEMGTGDTFYTYVNEPHVIKTLGDEPCVTLCWVNFTLLS